MAVPGRTYKTQPMDKQEKELECCVTQCDLPLDETYWNTQWENGTTRWDIGYASPAITAYMDQYPNKSAAILIPGCGNAYEAAYLAAQGFTDITLIDIAPAAVALLREKFETIRTVKVINGDFFEHQGQYDLMIEQTFFCALEPKMRKTYAQKAADLLKTNGKIVGLLFDRTFEKKGPPFGGCPCEYKPFFEPYFTVKCMDECANSIPERAKTEVFINLVKN